MVNELLSPDFVSSVCAIPDPPEGEQMANPHKQPVLDDNGTSLRFGKYKLDQLNAERVGRHLVLFHPNEASVDDLMVRARAAIPGIAKTENIHRVLQHNSRCMYAVSRKSRFNPEKPYAEGFIAFLPLNMLGLQHLALGTFNGPDPDVRLIAKEHERPAGIYMWAVFAPGPLAAGMALFMREMAAPQYAGVNIYSRPNTDVGVRFNQTLGLTKGAKVGSIEAPNVWMFPREPERPLYDSYFPGSASGEINVTVARSFDDMMRAAAIRNAVYIGEQECPYEEEYDGNDLSGTHLLAYEGDEPVGCIRLRFFADFAKIERLAIRKEFRKSRAAFQLVWAAIAFCQKKGYTKVYAHSQVRLVNFWKRFGFNTLEGGKEFVFSDFDYVEIVAEIPRIPDAIAIGTDPYVIIRPEGRWHVTGILEQSAERAATRPSVGDGH
jgi:predicted GNAT family N-acyltransferase